LRQLDPLRNRVEKQVSPACLLAHPEQGCTEGVLMMNYLPKDATIEQACNWLQAKTGETWILQRLIECGLRPHFWLDYSPGLPAIFGDRLEGFQTSMVFQGDLTRLEADGADALVTMFTAHDGKLIKTEPGWRVPLSDLRFKRADIERIAEIVNRDTAAATESAPERDAATALSTSVIAGCFAGFNGWNFAQWKSNLQDPAKWLKDCRHKAGRQGKPFIESTWRPVDIALALSKKDPKISKSLRARFRNQEPLKPWLDDIENNLPEDAEI